MAHFSAATTWLSSTSKDPLPEVNVKMTSTGFAILRCSVSCHVMHDTWMMTPHVYRITNSKYCHHIQRMTLKNIYVCLSIVSSFRFTLIKSWFEEDHFLADGSFVYSVQQRHHYRSIIILKAGPNMSYSYSEVASHSILIINFMLTRSSFAEKKSVLAKLN